MNAQELRNQNVYFLSLQFKTNPTVKGRNFPPAEIIPLVGEVYVTEDKVETKRVIRYMPGEKSIFFEDQDPANKYDKKTGNIKKYKESFVMRNGFMVFNRKESHALDYLRASSYNNKESKEMKINGKNLIITRVEGVSALFKERDVEQEAKSFIKEDKEELELRNLVYNMTVDELEAMALALGDTDASERLTDEVRRDLSILAKSDPTKFKNALNDKAMQRKVYINRAINANFIKYDTGTRKLLWAEGKEICDIPPGVDFISHFAALSASGEHQKTLQGMKDLLEGKEAPVIPTPEQGKSENEIALEKEVMELRRKAQASTELDVMTKPVEPVEFTEAHAEELFEKALKRGVVTRKASWYSVRGHKNFGKGFKNSVSVIASNTKLKELIITRLNKP